MPQYRSAPLNYRSISLLTHDPDVAETAIRQTLFLRHHRWFNDGLATPNRLHLIASDLQGCPVGQIRFDLQPNSTDNAPREALIDLSLDRCARGKGGAKELVRLGLLAMQENWGFGTEAVAEVLNNNSPSQATFAKAGFLAEPISITSQRFHSATRWRWRPTS